MGIYSITLVQQDSEGKMLELVFPDQQSSIKIVLAKSSLNYCYLYEYRQLLAVIKTGISFELF